MQILTKRLDPQSNAVEHDRPMQPIEHALITFFERVARKDKVQIDKLKQQQCFLVEQGRWCFTLPDLYSFLRQQDDVFRYTDYKLFRRALFSSPINAIIRQFDAEVIIADNRAKVDHSRYALVWHHKG
jgi:hypothetical protein